MQPFITLPYRLERDPPVFETNAIKYPESLVRHFLRHYTKRGARVFDPFAGLGTTLFVAEEMGRTPYGMEYDPKRYEWVAGQLEHWGNLVHGDSARVGAQGFPKMDFCMSSPPFMPMNQQWNPLYAGDPSRAGYTKYLSRMKTIYSRVADIMKRNAVIVIQCDNIPGRVYTPLVRDLNLCLSKIFKLENEVIIAWDGGKKDYRHTHCLIFKNSRR